MGPGIGELVLEFTCSHDGLRNLVAVKRESDLVLLEQIHRSRRDNHIWIENFPPLELAGMRAFQIDSMEITPDGPEAAQVVMRLVEHHPPEEERLSLRINVKDGSTATLEEGLRFLFGLAEGIRRQPGPKSPQDPLYSNWLARGILFQGVLSDELMTKLWKVLEGNKARDHDLHTSLGRHLRRVWDPTIEIRGADKTEKLIELERRLAELDKRTRKVLPNDGPGDKLERFYRRKFGPRPSSQHLRLLARFMQTPEFSRERMRLLVAIAGSESVLADLFDKKVDQIQGTDNTLYPDFPLPTYETVVADVTAALAAANVITKGDIPNFSAWPEYARSLVQEITHSYYDLGLFPPPDVKPEELGVKPYDPVDPDWYLFYSKSKFLGNAAGSRSRDDISALILDAVPLQENQRLLRAKGRTSPDLKAELEEVATKTIELIPS